MSKIEQLSKDYDFRDLILEIKQIANLKNREVLRESVSEMKRQGNWVCIYPSQGCDIYDKYFTGVRPYNRFLYRSLFTNELQRRVEATKPKV